MYGEHLDLVEGLHTLKTWTGIWDWNGSPLTRDEVIGSFGEGSDLNVIDTNGEYGADTGFSDATGALFQPLGQLDDKNGHSWSLDNQYLSVPQMTVMGFRLGKFAEHSRYFRFVYFDSRDEKLLATSDFGFFWTNAPWKNNLDIGDPQCYVCNDGGSSGGAFSGISNIEGYAQ